MTKAEANKTLTTLKKALLGDEPNLSLAERNLGSLQTRQGIRLARINEILASRKDLPNFKEWIEKHYVGRSYSTANRWKVAGKVALTLGFDESSKDLPPVMELEPLNGLDDDVIVAGWLKSEKGKGTRASRVKAYADSHKGTGSGSSSSGSGGNNTPTAPADSAGATTVTFDPAAHAVQIEKAGKVLESMDKKVVDAIEGLTPAKLRAIRLETVRMVGKWTEPVMLTVLGVTVK